MATIKEIPVKVVREHAYCECGGELVPNGIVLTSHPPKFQHECQSCKRVEVLDDRYPLVVTKTIQ